MSFEQKLDMIMKQVPTTTTTTTTTSNTTTTIDQMKPISITTPKSVKIIGPTTSRLNLSSLPSKTTNTNTKSSSSNSSSSNSTFTPKSILSNKDESKKKSVKIVVPSDKERENVAHIANTKGRSPMKSSLVSSNKNRVTISEPAATTTSTKSITTSTKSSSSSSSNPFATLLG